MASLVVKVTHALDDPERAHLGCNVAAVAAASGLEVQLFLALEGVRLAQLESPGKIHVEHAPPIVDLLEAIYVTGTVTVCAPCATRRELVQADFRPETEMAGAARFVELMTAAGTTTLVY